MSETVPGFSIYEIVNFCGFKLKSSDLSLNPNFLLIKALICVSSQHVLELKNRYKLVGQSSKRSHMTHLKHF